MGSREPVADTANSFDKAGAELGAKVMDMYFHCVAFDFLLPAIKGFFER